MYSMSFRDWQCASASYPQGLRGFDIAGLYFQTLDRGTGKNGNARRSRFCLTRLSMLASNVQPVALSEQTRDPYDDPNVRRPDDSTASPDPPNQRESKPALEEEVMASEGNQGAPGPSCGTVAHLDT